MQVKRRRRTRVSAVSRMRDFLTVVSRKLIATCAHISDAFIKTMRVNESKPRQNITRKRGVRWTKFANFSPHLSRLIVTRVDNYTHVFIHYSAYVIVTSPHSGSDINFEKEPNLNRPRSRICIPFAVIYFRLTIESPTDPSCTRKCFQYSKEQNQKKPDRWTDT